MWLCVKGCRFSRRWHDNDGQCFVAACSSTSCGELRNVQNMSTVINTGTLPLRGSGSSATVGDFGIKPAKWANGENVSETDFVHSYTHTAGLYWVRSKFLISHTNLWNLSQTVPEKWFHQSIIRSKIWMFVCPFMTSQKESQWLVRICEEERAQAGKEAIPACHRCKETANQKMWNSRNQS